MTHSIVKKEASVSAGEGWLVNRYILWSGDSRAGFPHVVAGWIKCIIPHYLAFFSEIQIFPSFTVDARRCPALSFCWGFMKIFFEILSAIDRVKWLHYLVKTVGRRPIVSLIEPGGNSSEVEHRLAKARVAGSNPVSRSIEIRFPWSRCPGKSKIRRGGIAKW